MNLADNVKVLTAGAIAGAVSRTATAPLERLKIFNQVGAISASASLYNKGVWRSLTNMYRDEGVRGFYKGNGTNCVKVVPVSSARRGHTLLSLSLSISISISISFYLYALTFNARFK
jgi:hypothetical protein